MSLYGLIYFAWFSGGDPSSDDIGAPLLETVAPLSEQPKSVQLGFIAGTIPVDKIASF